MLAQTGCFPLNPYLFGESEGTSSEGGGTASSTGTVVVTTGAGPGSSSGGSSDSGSSNGATGTSMMSGGTSEGLTFIPPADDGMCNLSDQTCPAGQKCTFNGAGSSWFYELKCVPVVEHPVGLGEACVITGDVLGGLDNCEAGAMCWGGFSEPTGSCIPICTFDAGPPECPPWYGVAYARDVVCMCMPACDPLVQDCVNPEDLCTEVFGRGFFCVFDASGEDGQLHDPCGEMNECDPGLDCVGSQAAVECDPQKGGCCEPFCDLNQPNTCPGQGQACLPYYDPDDEYAPEGYEHLGLCAVPR